MAAGARTFTLFGFESCIIDMTICDEIFWLSVRIRNSTSYKCLCTCLSLFRRSLSSSQNVNFPDAQHVIKYTANKAPTKHIHWCNNVQHTQHFNAYVVHLCLPCVFTKLNASIITDCVCTVENIVHGIILYMLRLKFLCRENERWIHCVWCFGSCACLCKTKFAIQNKA